jgi:hypothetical protein
MLGWLFCRNVSFLVCKKEYDSPEVDQLISWFKTNGWDNKKLKWYVVGSQEISTYQISKEGITAKLTFETYEGVILKTKKIHAHLFEEIRITRN